MDLWDEVFITNDVSPTRPFLRWAGSKTRIAPYILPHLAGKTRLIEPFAGSCALFLQSLFKHAILSDINFDLINLYKFLQAEKGDFIDYVEQNYFNKSRNGFLTANSLETYQMLKDRFNELLSVVLAPNPDLMKLRERAGLFVYLNKHDFNGICRYNSSGLFNAPYGYYSSVYFPRKEMQNFIQRTQHVEFRHCSFEDSMREVIENGDKDDVIYADPPYIEISKTASFKTYTKDSFSNKMHDNLVELANKARDRGILTLISNHDVDLARGLYEEGKSLTSDKRVGSADQIEKFQVQRKIAASGEKRIKVSEILAIYDPNA